MVNLLVSNSVFIAFWSARKLFMADFGLWSLRYVTPGSSSDLVSSVFGSPSESKRHHLMNAFLYSWLDLASLLPVYTIESFIPITKTK